MTAETFRKLIENEAAKRELTVGYLCKLAVGNNRLHRTLSSGGSCTLDVMERFRAYIEANPAADPADAA